MDLLQRDLHLRQEADVHGAGGEHGVQGQEATLHASKRPKPVVSGWVVSGYLNCPLRRNYRNAYTQQFQQVV